MKRLLITTILCVPYAVSATFAQMPLRLISFRGLVTDVEGHARSGIVGLTFAIYEDAVGGAPLWLETHNVALDVEGRYQVILGTTTDGVPSDFFTRGAARWLGVHVNSEAELPRVQILSVPYAVVASEALTLAGRKAEEFALLDSVRDTVRQEVKTQTEEMQGSHPVAATTSTANVIPKYLDTNGTLTDSSLAESGGRVGIGTSNPSYLTQVHSAGGHALIQLTNAATGSGPADGAYFGVLNGEKIFRLYNLEDASISFYTNNVTRMTIGATGKIGIGTPAPNYLTQLHSHSGHALLQLTSGTTGGTAVDGVYFGVLAGDPTFRIMNQENAAIDLFTNGAPRMTITAAGKVGIGTASPSPSSLLHVAGNATVDGQFVSTVPTGTPPLAVNSTTQVANLNASLLGGMSADAARTRGIVYLGGCDTCSPLADSDDQKTIYFNVVGPMTIQSGPEQ